MSALELEGVTVAYGDRVVLTDATLAIESGEVVAVHGPSGSGKSTLLRAIAGIVPLVAGRVRIDGVDITDRPTHRRGVGMVFQDDQLFPHLTVRDNVAFGLRMQGVGRAERGRAATEWIGRVGLTGFEQRRVDGLSGGEAKRVALARTLAPRPAIVLLDEPLTGLDDELHDRLATDLADVLGSSHTAALLVTHDRAEAALVAHRAVELADLCR